MLKRILLIGPRGQIGWELLRCAQPLGQIFPVGRSTNDQMLIHLDLADIDSIRNVIREIRPDVILNAAAYTAVDNAEKEAKLVKIINGEAPGIIAEEAQRLNALFIHYSTDYVFDGNQTRPYTEQDAVNPASSYGESKLVGEQAVQSIGGKYLILRTSWVYGTRGKNFLLTMQRLAKERGELKIVADQVGSPTWSRLIAEATAHIIAQLHSPLCHSDMHDVSGIYHLTCAGKTTWYDFAKAIIAPTPHRPKIKPLTTAEYPTPAKRPAYSVLSNAKLTRNFGIALPTWDVALKLCLENQELRVNGK